MATAGSPQGPSPLVVTVQTWYNGLPLCTKAAFSLITGVFVLQLFMGWYGDGKEVYGFCLMPSDTLYHYQVYRVLTSAAIHGGLLHITFNMLAFVPMGCSLERLVGTVQFTYLVLLFTVLEGALYVVASWLLETSGLLRGAMHHCALGFSGVIFGLLVVDNAQSGASQRSIFGLFTVPAALYPWALLVFWQLLMPSVSFIGHLAGVMVGQLWVWGYLRPLALSRSVTVGLEQSWALSRCIRFSSFIMMPGATLPYTSYDTARGASGSGGAAGGSTGSRLGGFGRGFATLGKLLRSGSGGAASGGAGAGSVGADSAAEAGAAPGGGDGEPGGPSRGAFAGTGRVLGGGASGPGGSAPPASVAAALAAESRAGPASGSGGPRAAHEKPARDYV